jgi:hypothetical protein
MRSATRRELLLISGLAAASCAASLLGIGGLLLLRRSTSPRAVPTQDPAPTAPAAPFIVPRSAWGAREPDHTAPNEFGYAQNPLETSWWVYQQPLEDVYTTLVVHHTAHSGETMETMIDVQALHMDRNGWADIGYHFGIDQDGNIYEGRDIQVRGASVSGYNTGLIGVALMGNFEIELPSEAQMIALTSLGLWLAQKYRLSHLAGHQDFNASTACPGVNLRVSLEALAIACGLQHGTGGYTAPSGG